VQQHVDATPISVSGSIAITGIERGGEEGGIYELVFPARELRKIQDGNYFAPALSGDGKISVITETSENEFGLVVARTIEGADAVTVVPPQEGIHPSTSAWSHDGRYLAYAAREVKEREEVSVAESRVVLLDTATGEQVVVGRGASPSFMPDGSIVYVGEFGIYRVTRVGMKLEQPQGFIGFRDTSRSAASSISLVVSKDGTQIAVADPDVSELRLYNVDNEYKLGNERTVRALANMPVFSPDGTKLAYVALRRESAESNLIKNVVVLDTTTLEGEYVADVSKFDDYMFSLGVWK
jgi:Tol biopolymer transport system component